ncbi:MAG: hypothetical protein O7A03_06670, partial [Alphaproteobacteria bacterium]|nr:hypothetical protein [Alphaproteobacteria bacterium]
RPVGRRSALGLIGRGMLSGGALSLAPRLVVAQTFDTNDRSSTADPDSDTDTGANADPAADADIAVLSDRASNFDQDASLVGDPADQDVQPLADPGDNDLTVLGDRKAAGASDAADIDISARGDQIPDIDVDPGDTGGDADQSTRADIADQD